MSATQAGDGRWRCDGCGNLFVNQQKAENHHPTEQAGAVAQAAEVVGGVVEAFGQVADLAVMAVDKIAQSDDVHADQYAKWAELKATVESLNARLEDTITRLVALESAPETEHEPPVEEVT